MRCRPQTPRRPRTTRIRPTASFREPEGPVYGDAQMTSVWRARGNSSSFYTHEFPSMPVISRRRLCSRPEMSIQGDVGGMSRAQRPASSVKHKNNNMLRLIIQCQDAETYRITLMPFQNQLLRPPCPLRHLPRPHHSRCPWPLLLLSPLPPAFPVSLALSCAHPLSVFPIARDTCQ